MLGTDDIAGLTFTTSRLREGYEIAEVDGFRTDVLEAITARDKVISELREELAAARVHPATAGDGVPDGAPREGLSAAARLLELAANNADQLVAEATAEADSLVSGARSEAEELLAASRAETEQVTTDLARRKEEQAAELEEHRRTVLADVAARKSSVEARVESLQQLETEHRNQLRRHFTEHLAQLEDDEPAMLRAVAAD